MEYQQTNTKVKHLKNEIVVIALIESKAYFCRKKRVSIGKKNPPCFGMSLWSEIFKVETKMCNIKSQTETNISYNYDKKYENQILKFVDTNDACSFFF